MGNLNFLKSAVSLLRICLVLNYSFPVHIKLAEIILFQTMRCLLISNYCYLAVEFFICQIQFIVKNFAIERFYEFFEMVYNHCEIFNETLPYKQLLISKVIKLKISESESFFFKSPE